MTISGNAIVSEVEKFVGDPYVYGAEGPTSFDCSGLVQFVLTKLGVANVPRTSEAQYAWADKISASDLEPGDLVFAQFPGDNASPGHVGVYVGGGRVLSAEDPAEGVGFDTLANWGDAIVGYGRVPDSTAGTGTGGTSASLAGSILSWPTEITGAFGQLDTILKDILSPSFWLRIASFFAGVGLLIAGIWCLMHASDDSSLVPDLSSTTIPVPI
jgi:cell wall-associated NlpC family hydrolase